MRRAVAGRPTALRWHTARCSRPARRRRGDAGASVDSRTDVANAPASTSRPGRHAAADPQRVARARETRSRSRERGLALCRNRGPPARWRGEQRDGRRGPVAATVSGTSPRVSAHAHKSAEDLTVAAEDAAAMSASKHPSRIPGRPSGSNAPSTRRCGRSSTRRGGWGRGSGKMAARRVATSGATEPVSPRAGVRQAPEERARGAHAPGDEHKCTRDLQAPVAPVEEHAPLDELDVPRGSGCWAAGVVQSSWVCCADAWHRSRRGRGPPTPDNSSNW